MDKNRYSLLCDFYELTMSNGYLSLDMKDKVTYFDVFFRSVPDGGGYAIFAGLEQFVDYIRNLRFSKEDIEFLRGKNMFTEDFLHYLENFRFSGDIWAIPEGTPVFPNEPLVTVRATAPEAQLIETFALLTFNHQSLIATKASRIVRAADGRTVLEFGSRRAQGPDAAVIGARAAYIGGVDGTACTLTDALYGVPSGGTMAHSWIMMFNSEYEAFETYCRLHPNNVTLLVDTYDTLKSGVPNAIRAFKEVLLPLGIDKFAIRLDSGDLAFLSRKAREMLDAAGMPNCKIVASNALDEWLIRDLLQQGACIDTFGVGEKLITSSSKPVFGCVYKLVAIEGEDGEIIPKIKISENPAKITNPHFKKVYRIYEKSSGKAIADQICLRDENICESKTLHLFDPDKTWKRKEVRDFRVQELQKPIFINGELVYELPSLEQIRAYCKEQKETIWEEVKRFENPHNYYVDLSEKLWNIKEGLLNKGGQE